MNEQQILVYVASPLRAKTDIEELANMRLAGFYTEYVNDALRHLDMNIKAVAPHAHMPKILQDRFPAQRELALKFGRELLAMCSLLVLVTKNGISEGMKQEAEHAASLGIPVVKVDYANKKEGQKHILDSFNTAMSKRPKV